MMIANTFDIALSIYVTVMWTTKCIKTLWLVSYVKCLYWATRWKSFSAESFHFNILTDGANEEVVQKKIDQVAISTYSTQPQISKAFDDLHDVVCVGFAYNKMAHCFKLKMWTRRLMDKWWCGRLTSQHFLISITMITS